VVRSNEQAAAVLSFLRREQSMSLVDRLEVRP
jgi:hypothetical protein